MALGGRANFCVGDRLDALAAPRWRDEPTPAVIWSENAMVGVYIPTTATDLYFAELVRWFGFADGDLGLVLPNLDRFYSPSQGAPLGFL